MDRHCERHRRRIERQQFAGKLLRGFRFSVMLPGSKKSPASIVKPTIIDSGDLSAVRAVDAEAGRQLHACAPASGRRLKGASHE